MSTIQLQLQPSGMASSTDLTYDDWSSVKAGSEPGDYPSTTVRARAKRSDSITSWNSVTREALPPSSGTLVNSSGQLTLASSDPIGSPSANQSSVSVGASSNADGKQSLEASALPPPTGATPASSSTSGIVFDRSWEVEIENMLKVRNRSYSGGICALMGQTSAGDLQCSQGSADSATHRQHASSSVLDVIAEPPWDGSSEPERPCSAGPSDNAQAREYSRPAVYLGCPGPQSVQQREQYRRTCQSST